MSTSLQHAYDPDIFKRDGHELIDLLARHLKEMQGKARPTYQSTTPESELEKWRNYKIESIGSFFDDVINGSIALHHPQYVGHQVSAPLPLTALAGMVSDLLNNGMGIFEMGAAATAMEKVGIESFCDKIGFGNEGGGFLTSGGTLANLTALLAARAHAKYKGSDDELYILVSEQAHYCIERAAHTMGLARQQIIKIPTDENYCICSNELRKKVKELRANSKSVLAIVASACTTATGAYDPIDKIADVCEEFEIWCHVDGAHGGAVAWSSKYKHLIKGIDRADSVIIDAHKMMMIPALATAVLFKNLSNSYRTFQQDAHYLWQDENPEWYNLAKRTYETTKYMASIKIFLLFKWYGDSIIDEYITRQYDLTIEFAEFLKTCHDIEIGHTPQSNILCFRYTPPIINSKNIDQLNSEIRKAIIENGDFYIVQAKVDAKIYLRITIMNPLTTFSDLKNLYAKITTIGRILNE